MKILIATSEAVPFAKTGGLADVCGSLPRELAALGHEPVLIMPAYKQALESGISFEPTSTELYLPVGQKSVYGRLLSGKLPNSDIPVYLVQQPHYFERGGLYGEHHQDYADNCERFVYFCRAVVAAQQAMGGGFDVVHCNDWQTGLIPAYLKLEYGQEPGHEAPATLFTIHNLAYQGQFWHWDMLLTGLDWRYFNWQQMEFYGKLNLMKTGLVFADAINTVSPRYAEEIQGPELGCGLEGVLKHRRRILSGIVNGVDYDVWNPATDKALPANFDADHIEPGKGVCKKTLQEHFGLEVNPNVPLIGFVGRLVEQKGIDLITAVLGHDWANQGQVQWVILGSGEPRYQDLLTEASRRNPRNIAVRIGYSEELSHRIEAGADIFMMPSRYEPCGLNQLYSLKYGSVPVVRATGGLADTVVNATPANIESGAATGFCFHEYSTYAFGETLQNACEIYRTQPDIWTKIRDAGMRADWSWRRSAEQYIQLYERTVNALAAPPVLQGV